MLLNIHSLPLSMYWYSAERNNSNRFLPIVHCSVCAECNANLIKNLEQIYFVCFTGISYPLLFSFFLLFTLNSYLYVLHFTVSLHMHCVFWMWCKFNQELGGNLLSKTFLLFPPLEKALLQVLRQLENSLQTVIYHGVGGGPNITDGVW